MNAPGDKNDDKRADDRRRDYRQPLVGKQIETTHQTDTGGNEEKTEIFDEEIGDFVDP